jgi:hypothetical protein
MNKDQGRTNSQTNKNNQLPVDQQFNNQISSQETCQTSCRSIKNQHGTTVHKKLSERGPMKPVIKQHSKKWSCIYLLNVEKLVGWCIGMNE